MKAPNIFIKIYYRPSFIFFLFQTLKSLNLIRDFAFSFLLFNFLIHSVLPDDF